MITEVRKHEIIDRISHCIVSAKENLRWYESTGMKMYFVLANDFLKEASEYVAQINGIYR